MATHRWTGQTIAVAQTATVQITAYDVATTYKLTVGGVVVSTLGTGGTVNTTATALAAAWEASTHPYFSGVSATANTDTVTLTSLTAGVPFTATSSVTGGTGTIGSVTAGTANAGPNVLAAANMDSGSLPSNGDTLIFENSSVSVLWALDAMTSTTTLTVIVYPTFTGYIGLNKRVFQQTATGTSSTAPEYREDELTIDGATLFWLPKHNGVTSPSKSPRILANFKTSAATVRIEDTANTSADTDLEPVRLKGSNASSVAYITGPSWVGFATNDPADTAQFDLAISGSGKINGAIGLTCGVLTIRESPTIRIDKIATTINAGDKATTAKLITTMSTGTITTLTLGENATLTHVGGAVTVTTLNQYGDVDLTAATGTFTVTTWNVLSGSASLTDRLNRTATNVDFVFGPGISPDNFFGLAGGRTLRKTA